MLTCPSLCRVALCVSWGTPSAFSQAAGNSALVFTSYFHRALRPTRVENFRPSLVSPRHLYSLAYSRGLRLLGTCSNLLWTSHFLAFPFKGFCLPCCCLSVASGSDEVKAFDADCFWQACTFFPTGPKRTALQMGLPGNHQTSQIMTVIWDWCF